MSHFSWTRASYVMFGLAVFAALIKLWSPDISGSESLAAEKRTSADTPRISTKTGKPNTEIRELPILELPDPKRESFVRHEAVPSIGREASGDPETSEPANDPPVFYRPAPEASDDASDDNPQNSGPVCGDLGDFPKSSRIVFPLQDDYFYSYDDTWGAPRPQGGHEGTDLMSPSGTPEYAITDGTVVPVSGSNEEGWNTLGGYAVMVRADYDIGPVREGDLFYYAHMNEKSPLPVGAKVQAGQVVGYAGDTGQGPEVTRGLFPPHLHLGWYDGGGNRSDLESGAMNPYPLLEWLKRNGGSVVGGSGARYCEGPRPASAPSAGTGGWTFPSSPGKSPDLNTGTEDPRPSPIIRERQTAAHTAENKTKEYDAHVVPQRRKNARTAAQKASVTGKSVPVNRPELPASPEGERRADQMVSRERPAQAGSGGDRRSTGSTQQSPERRRGAEAPPKKADSESSPGTKRGERPEKPKPSEERECDAGCSTDPDDPQTTEDQAEETTTPESEAKPQVGGEAGPNSVEDRSPGETVGLAVGKGETSEGEKDSIP